MNILSVGSIRVALTPSRSEKRFTSSCMLEWGGTAMVNHRLKSWFRS